MTWMSRDEYLERVADLEEEVVSRMYIRALRLLGDNSRHSADTVREVLWREYPEASDELVDRAVERALP